MAAEPSPAAERERAASDRRAVPFLGLVAGTCMADANITSTALVDAARGLGMAPGLMPVAASAMSTLLAATVVSTGLLADRKGRRRILLLALLTAIGSEALTAASPAPAVFIGGRALTGVAMGAAFSAAYATVRDVTPPARLGAALGLFGGVTGATLLAVSFVGGALATLHWRLAFLTIPVVFAICIVVVPRLLPDTPRVGAGPVDALGQLLLAIGVAGPLIGLGQATASLGSPRVWVPVLVGAAALTAFVARERRTGHPFYPVALFRNRLFVGAVLLGFGFNVSQSVLLLQLSDVLQYVRGFSTVQVSLAQVPALAAGVLASVVAGRRLSAGTTDRRVGAGGYAAVVIGFCSLLLYRLESPFWVLLPALLLVGAGAQVLQVPFAHLMVTVAPPSSYGPVTSSRLTIGQMAFAAGMAGSTVLIDTWTVNGLTERLTTAGVSAHRTQQAIEAVALYVQWGDPATTDRARQALALAEASYLQAFAATMAVMAGVLAVAGVAAWLVLRPARRAAITG